MPLDKMYTNECTSKKVHHYSHNILHKPDVTTFIYNWSLPLPRDRRGVEPRCFLSLAHSLYLYEGVGKGVSAGYWALTDLNKKNNIVGPLTSTNHQIHCLSMRCDSYLSLLSLSRPERWLRSERSYSRWDGDGDGLSQWEWRELLYPLSSSSQLERDGVGKSAWKTCKMWLITGHN